MLSEERLDELFSGCPSCEGGFDEAPCTCPGPDEIRSMIYRIRALEKENQIIQSVMTLDQLRDAAKVGLTELTKWRKDFERKVGYRGV